MPLDEREQRILEDIERHLHEEDPELAKAVRGARLPLPSANFAIAGVVVGVLLMVLTFTQAVWLALVGFGLAVASATVLVSRSRRPEKTEHENGSGKKYRPFTGR